MKRRFLFSVIILLGVISFTNANAQRNRDRDIDYLQQNVSEIERKVEEIQKHNENLEATMSQKSNELRIDNATLHNSIDSVNSNINKIESQLEKTDKTVANQHAKIDNDIKKILVFSISALTALLAICLTIYFWTRLKQNSNSKDINMIKKVYQNLSEQQVKLDNKLAELFDHQLKNEALIQESKLISYPSEVDHSLVLAISGELVRIDQNLSFMDQKTKGVSQLRNRTSAIYTTLKNKGYEIPKLMGTEFKDGMNYEAVMEEDEDMEPGIMRIKRVVQPCVMYKGIMIQPAKVIVAYNPDN